MQAPGQAAPGSLARAGEKWRELGAHYDERRFRGDRARERDARRLGALLGTLDLPRGALVLDAPCGTGRLRTAIEAAGARSVGLDLSSSMLARAREAGAPFLLCASLDALPHRERAFEVVVACRILHHLDEEALRTAVRELVRVARMVVIATFWDAASLPAWRVRAGWKPSEGEGGRRAHARGLVRQAFASAGAARVRFRAVARFLSQQTFVVAYRD